MPALMVSRSLLFKIDLARLPPAFSPALDAMVTQPATVVIQRVTRRVCRIILKSVTFLSRTVDMALQPKIIN